VLNNLADGHKGDDISEIAGKEVVPDCHTVRQLLVDVAVMTAAVR
jgi:hypothetical protein